MKTNYEKECDWQTRLAKIVTTTFVIGGRAQYTIRTKVKKDYFFAIEKLGYKYLIPTLDKTPRKDGFYELTLFARRYPGKVIGKESEG